MTGVSLPSARAEELVRVSGALYDRGWMPGTAGNLSVRLTADRALITASGRSKGELTAADTVLVDIDTGRPVGDDQPRPSAETAIHLAVYRAFPDCGAVAHAHPPYSTVAASGAAPGATHLRFAKFEIIKGLGVTEPDSVDIPLFANWPHVPDIAADIARRFADAASPLPPALLIAHHGATAWGATLAQARDRLECVEALCQLDLLTDRKGEGR